MSVLLLTGPLASGKNTIGELLARRVGRCASIDVDVLSQMFAHGKELLSDVQLIAREQHLAVDNACSLAHNFANASYKVVISDIVTSPSIQRYKHQLANLEVVTLLLLPSEEEITARLLSRPDYLSRPEPAWVYDQQARFDEYDYKLDNTSMTPEEVVDWIIDRWPGRNS